MKLRNKKTGEIESVSIDTFGVDEKDRRIGISVLDFNSPSDYRCIASYSSLAELNEEWEDYKPKEPLIKDEKIRKAVRAWADVLGVGEAEFYGAETWIGLRTTSSSGYSSKFELDCSASNNTLVPFRVYTITELCGEEEE